MSTDPSSPLRLRLSRRARRVRLRVLPDGNVELVLPEGSDVAAALAFAESNRPWVERARARLLGRRLAQEAAVRAIPDTIDLPALGESWRLELVTGPEGVPRVRSLAGQRLRLVCSGSDDWVALLRAWLRRRGAETLPAWLEQVAARTGLQYARVQVRLQRSRWGSCSSRGTISLNAKLLLLTPALVDYLMVHELCHTRVMSHSAKFWRLVESKQPGALELDRSLRRVSRNLPAWAEQRPRTSAEAAEW